MKSISHLARNISTALHDPETLQKWMQYQWAGLMRREPALRIGGGVFSGFPHFSAFLGAWKYRPDDAEMRFLSHNLRAAKVVLDVGANFGILTVLMGELAPSAKVFAVETNPETFATLDRNVKSNGLGERVFCAQVAMGDAVGMAPFLDTGAPATNRLAPKGGNTFDVAVTTVDLFCQEHQLPFVDFMKIDVEGAELDVLKGASALFARHLVRSGMIEVCPGNLTRFGKCVADLRAFFEAYDYDLFWFGADGRPSDAVSGNLPDDFLGDAGFTSKRQLAEEAGSCERDA